MLDAARRLLPGASRRLKRLLHARSRKAPSSQPLGLDAGVLTFACNICSGRASLPLSGLSREGGHCPHCDSSMRYRALIRALSVGLFGRSLAIRAFPAHAHSLTGLGMSDSPKYARPLRRALGYTNTWYHGEPRLDILAPRAERLGAHDFVISADVLEHVGPPVERAFANLRRLLRPGGLLVLTVPYSLDDRTREHFPALHDYRLERRAGRHVLRNRTVHGRSEEFSDLAFHGGPGSTLELRLFAERSLLRHLEEAGFRDVVVHRDDDLGHGIRWPQPWSLPITARAAT
jgi:SAM-dependent methyltransferase